MERTIERVVLGILVVVVVVEAYLAYAAYSQVQAQTARIAALESRIEREVATLRTEAEARARRLEDELARIRRP